MQMREAQQRGGAAAATRTAVGVVCGSVLAYFIGIAPMYSVYWTPVSVLALEALAVLATRSPRLRVFALTSVAAGALILVYSLALVVALGSMS